MLNDLTVVVICYDPYIDAIELNPFFVDKYWKDCSANVIYVTSRVNVNTNRMVLQTNEDLSYYGRLQLALEHTTTKYVMLLLDDYLIDKNVDENKIEQNIKFMEKNNVQFCELYTMFNIPKGKKVCYDDLKCIKVSNDQKYRINLQPSIFTRSLLTQLISYKPKTAWDAELIFMKEDFEQYDAFYSLNHSFSIANYIDKGMATRKAVRMLKKEKLWKNQRQVMSPFKTLKKRLVNKFSKFVPQKLKDKVKGNDIIYKG